MHLVFKAESETNDNLQFLSTLLPWFEKLHYATKSAEMVVVFPPLMHSMYLVWVYSRLVSRSCNHMTTKGADYISFRPSKSRYIQFAVLLAWENSWHFAIICHHWFPTKWLIRNDKRNSILLTRIWVVRLIGWGKFLTNQKHYPWLGSEVSSVWELLWPL